MIKKLFSIRDSKGEVYHSPFYKTTHGEAERDFISARNDEASMIWKYPEDFDLYYLGEYDDNSGTFDTLDTPQHVTKASNIPVRDQRARETNQASTSNA